MITDERILDVLRHKVSQEEADLIEGYILKLQAAVETAFDVFQYYGDLHAAKPDEVKEKRNYDLAAKMLSALSTQGAAPADEAMARQAANSAFVASAHQDLPWLITRIATLEKQVADGEGRAVSGKDIAAALQEAWDDWGADTSCFPECFTITRGPKIWANFAVSNFADHVATALNSRLESQPQPTEIARLRADIEFNTEQFDKIAKSIPADRMRERNQALEAAAKVCDAWGEKLYKLGEQRSDRGNYFTRSGTWNEAAAEIRALISKPEQEPKDV